MVREHWRATVHRVYKRVGHYLVTKQRQTFSNIYLTLTSNLLARDFPGGPVVKTSPSNAEGVGPIPGWGG